MNKTLTILLVLIILILIGGGGYLIFQNQRLAKQLAKPEPSAAPSVIEMSVPSTLPSTSPSPSRTLKDIQETVQSAVNSKNYQALVGYMQKQKVNFIIMSSSCCEPQTPDDAAVKLDYAKDGTPFDFNQNTTLIKSLKAKNDRLANAYIGLSQNKEHLVAFTIDANNQITQIEVSVSYKFYNL